MSREKQDEGQFLSSYYVGWLDVERKGRVAVRIESDTEDSVIALFNEVEYLHGKGWGIVDESRLHMYELFESIPRKVLTEEDTIAGIKCVVGTIRARGGELLLSGDVKGYIFQALADMIEKDALKPYAIKEILKTIKKDVYDES